MFSIKRFTAVLLLTILPASGFAALGLQTVWEINSTVVAKTNVNGGGFDPFQTTHMIADLQCTSGTTASPVCQSATYDFIAGDATNWLFLSSGGSVTANSFCQIASVNTGVSPHTATLTAGVGTCNIYGAPHWTTNTVAGIGAASPSSVTFAIDRSRNIAAAQNTTTASYTTATSLITVGGLTYDATYVGSIINIVTISGGTVGWYEITNAAAGTSFTIDRDAGSGGDRTNLAINIGGAFSMGSNSANQSDTKVMQLMTGTNGTGSMHTFVNGGFTIGAGGITTTGVGGTLAPVVFSGYGTVRDDDPVGTSRPAITGGTVSVVIGSNWIIRDFIITGTNATMWTIGTNSNVLNVKCTNSSPSTNRICMQFGAGGELWNSEVTSYRGVAISSTTAAFTAFGNYIHDSDVGFTTSATTQANQTLSHNLFVGNITADIRTTAAYTSKMIAENNTHYGGVVGTAPLGTGISLTSGTTNVAVINSIFTGMASGITGGDSGQFISQDKYNDYYSNTSDVSNWTKSATSFATNPQFTSAGQIAVADGTTGAANALSSATAHFTTGSIPVIAGRDYVYVSGAGGGTAVTVGVYGILTVNSDTTITTDIALTSGGSTVPFQIIVGRNFLPTVTLSGFPGSFQGGYSSGAQAVGAVVAGGSGGGRCIGCD